MAPFLHKLGDYAFRNPWKVIVVWVALLGLLGFGASQFIKPTSSAISIPGTEAQKAIDRANELFPDGGKGTGRVVFEATNNTKITDYREQIDALVSKIEKTDGVSQVASPFVDESFVSKDGTIAYAQIQLTEAVGSTSTETLDSIDTAIESTRTNNLVISSGGDLASRVPSEFLGIGEVVGVLVALLVLIMTLGSLIAAGMPLLTALVGIGVSMAGLFSMSQLFEINSTTPVLAIMLGLAVGIDYSLFIISKYRTLLLHGYDYREAVGRALGTAGNAVVFAALTVVIALAALSIVNIPFMTTMGLVGAGSIAIAALVAISLIPALLGVAGARVLGKKARVIAEAAQKKPGTTDKGTKNTLWYRWGALLAARPVPVLLAALLLVGVMAIPAKDLNLGLPTDQYAAVGSTERTAYDTLTRGFGPGFNGPLTVVVEGLPAVTQADKDAVRQAALAEYETKASEAAAAQQAAFAQKAANAVTLEDQITLQQEIAAAQAAGAQQQQAALAQIDRSVEEFAKLVQLKKVADKIATLDNVTKTLPAIATDNGTAGIIQVIPASAPSDQATKDLIMKLRSPSIADDLSLESKPSLAVTGSTALQEDISDKLAKVLPQYLGVVVGLSLILLIVAFRSIVVPIKATLGFLLSVAAMFGALVAVFQWGWFGIADAPGLIVSFIPIIAIGILFGLAMDYEFFLVSGMHEAFAHGKTAKQAVVEGFGAGAKVVTAAGVIMVSVFAGFVFNHDSTIQAMGFGLAIGILIDAFIVRMTIVPAAMSLLGKSAWWLPRWLDKRLPHISIEGEH